MFIPQPAATPLYKFTGTFKSELDLLFENEVWVTVFLRTIQRYNAVTALRTSNPTHMVIFFTVTLNSILILYRSWSDDIPTGWEARAWFPAGQNFLFPAARLRGPSNLPSDGYKGHFPGGKKAAAWSWPLNSIQCRGQERWIYTSTPMSSWRIA
jgi:hypothetical protein